MSFSDLLLKVANNARLTPNELDELKRHGTETQQRNSFVAGNTTAANQLNINFPFFPIYSEVLQKDTASLTIPIPAGYGHLFLIGGGRAAADNGIVLLRFNGDSGNNYSNAANTRANDGTQSGTGSTGATSTTLSLLVDSTGTATHAAHFFAIIPNYGGPFTKNLLSIASFRNTNFRFATTRIAFWDSAAAIESVTIFAGDLTGGDGVLAAGSLFSIYGVL